LPRGVLGGVVDDLAAGRGLRDDCATSPWYSALLMRAALWLIWLAPLWAQLRLRTFGALDEPARTALLEKLLTSPRYYVRMAVSFLKVTFCTILLGDERAHRRLGAYRLDEERPAERSAS
jgi:hypothetical protein